MYNVNIEGNDNCFFKRGEEEKKKMKKIQKNHFFFLKNQESTDIWATDEQSMTINNTLMDTWAESW